MLKEPNILTVLADNQALTDAVRAIIEKQFEFDDIETRTMLDGQIGQIVRARIEGLRKIRDAFNEIAKYKSTMVRQRTNPGR